MHEGTCVTLTAFVGYSVGSPKYCTVPYVNFGRNPEDHAHQGWFPLYHDATSFLWGIPRIGVVLWINMVLPRCSILQFR